jgi:hypothetical protein
MALGQVGRVRRGSRRVVQESSLAVYFAIEPPPVIDQPSSPIPSRR